MWCYNKHMNFTAILEVLPFAAAAAVSPLLFTIALLVAGQKKSSTLKSLLFILGAGISISVIGFVIFFVLGRLSPGSSYTAGDARLDLIIGLVLVAFALHQFFVAKPKKAHSDKNINDAEALSLGFGFMVVNTTTILMYLPAAHVASYYSDTIKVELLVIMVLFSLIPAIAPPLMLAFIHSPSKITAIKRFINRNARYIIAAIFGLIGILEIFKAVQFFIK